MCPNAQSGFGSSPTPAWRWQEARGLARSPGLPTSRRRAATTHSLTGWRSWQRLRRSRSGFSSSPEERR
eukprot:12105716-Alexandrium_andersonii.AAC.1